MAYSGLSDFITDLEERNELIRIKSFADPVLEITDITDRITKNGGKALLFENNGTDFPLLINAFASDMRMATAIGRENLDDAGSEIEEIFNLLSAENGSFIKKIKSLPRFLKLLTYMPTRVRCKGKGQKIIHSKPDLGILPVLKCWPFDGGRYITLPLVHTVHPVTGKTNVGMYRMQILGKDTTAMHWQRHKTGANHFEAWKKYGGKMPVSVALGGDPVYSYAATAPLPENISEYILAGFLRRKKVKLVKCITNDVYVPADADIIIEGYVDTMEDLVWEGPFGDHTGFYSLADWYPRFHVTCITHSENAVYPATIVGVPPMEDSWLAKATERIFLSPVKLTLQPEIEDFHMPSEGVAHNLVIVKIKKGYPGQGMKVISSLFGAGQMMFSKYLVVVSGDTDIRNYNEVVKCVFTNTVFTRDILFCRGPLDVLDHASDAFSFGGKAGIDATVKHAEELDVKHDINDNSMQFSNLIDRIANSALSTVCNCSLLKLEIPVAVVSVNRLEDTDAIDNLKKIFSDTDVSGLIKLILIVDHTVDINNYSMVAWQVLGNTDPQRDHSFTENGSLFLDGTIKAFRKGGFPRNWPNVVCASPETISTVDQKWDSLKAGDKIKSPSLKYMPLKRSGEDSVTIV